MENQNPDPIVYLSPHLDDAVLSCAGRIAQESRTGLAVWIVTIFAGDPPETAALIGVDGETMPNRRREDQHACALVGAACRHWPFPEAAYRRDPATGRPAYPELADLFGALHPADEAWIDQVAARINQLPPAARVLVPLGVGGHVDHAITRQAAERARGGELTYYEDFPYAQKWGALSKVLRPRRRWRSTATRVSTADLDLKCRAIAAHASQAWILFKDARDLRRKVVRYAFRRRGERYWRPR